MRAAVVIASVMCMRLSFACIWLARTGIHGAEVVGRWTHSAHGRMQNRGTGEWLVPGTTRDSNVQGPGKKAQLTGSLRCEGTLVAAGMWSGRPATM